MSLIDLRNVHKRFGRLVVLNGVSLSIEEGQSLVVIGASGSGKSVMLKHIVGLLKPDKGEVWYDGRRIDTATERQLDSVRQEFGFLFQMGALFDSLSVEENVAFPLVEHTRKSADEIAGLVKQKLAMVGLDGTQKKMPGELSGGQRKRVALARAIALGPRVILYDEPTTGLDPVRSDVINRLIVKLNSGQKFQIIDSSENPIFEVRENGTIHGKTGSAMRDCKCCSSSSNGTTTCPKASRPAAVRTRTLPDFSIQPVPSFSKCQTVSRLSKRASPSPGGTKGAGGSATAGVGGPATEGAGAEGAGSSARVRAAVPTRITPTIAAPTVRMDGRLHRTAGRHDLPRWTLACFAQVKFPIM